MQTQERKDITQRHSLISWHIPDCVRFLSSFVYTYPHSWSSAAHKGFTICVHIPTQLKFSRAQVYTYPHSWRSAAHNGFRVYPRPVYLQLAVGLPFVLISEITPAVGKPLIVTNQWPPGSGWIVFQATVFLNTVDNGTVLSTLTPTSCYVFRTKQSHSILCGLHQIC